MREHALLRSAVLPPLLVLAAAAISGCAGLPRHVEKTQSDAYPTPDNTSMGQIIEAEETGKDLSGVRLLSSGDEALASLLALADHAEKTLDIQYYIIHEDDSTRIFLHHLRMAADRGVRVRVLIDDLNTAGEDRRFMHLSEHRNVEVRIFNPFTAARFSTWIRWVASASEMQRVNHRMHNKLFVADNSIAITGGRNIGDQYFMRDPYSNYIDLDVVAAGPIVPELSASFDEFWNSKYAYPIAAVASAVDEEAPPVSPPDPPTAAGENWLEQELDAHQVALTWVPATVLADQPAKIATESLPEEQVTIASDIAALMSSAKQELIIISPYFIPGKQGMKLFSELTMRGVRIRIITNSLAATDSPLVDIGYSRYRAPLLKLGVELYEVRPKLGQKHARFHPYRSTNASLHAKALVIDQKTVFIGSLNMDERSAHINSELGLLINSADIAMQVTSLFDDISTDGSYRMRLQPGTDHVEWVISGDAGGEQVWRTDPGTSRTERLWLNFLSPFAPDEFL
jgi:phosphatidylserine/phosphatidylglycerophosphate/cardiolipin synthase-like enzyme